MRSLLAVIVVAVTAAPTATPKHAPPQVAAHPERRREAPESRDVLVDLLAKPAPRSLSIEGPGRRHALVLRGDTLIVDGQPTAAPFRLPAATWTLRFPGAPARRYPAALAIAPAGGRLSVRATFDLEPYVAAVVASEAAPGTPPAALRALAVVVRSYARSPAAPHEGGARCDLAHCQVLGGRATRAQAAAAEAAAQATAGQVLRLPGGRLAAAHFHAACGGRTANPRLAFGGEDGGSEGVADEGCPEAPWRARLTPAQVASALRGALARAGDPAAATLAAALRAADLLTAEGPGGWVAQVAASDGRWRLSGDAAARALDAEVGRGQVRSSRFTLEDEAGLVVVRGRGHGHGAGLCQAGSVRRARAGAGHAAILAAYFPGAVLAAASDTAR